MSRANKPLPQNIQQHLNPFLDNKDIKALSQTSVAHLQSRVLYEENNRGAQKLTPQISTYYTKQYAYMGAWGPWSCVVDGGDWSPACLTPNFKLRKPYNSEDACPLISCLLRTILCSPCMTLQCFGMICGGAIGYRKDRNNRINPDRITRENKQTHQEATRSRLFCPSSHRTWNNDYCVPLLEQESRVNEPVTQQMT